MIRKMFGFFIPAFKGIGTAFIEEVNVKLHVLAVVLVVGAGLYFGVSVHDWVVLVLAMALVISLELANTAIENLVDLFSTARSPLAGKIKDIAAGAVLVAAIGAAIVGILIFSKYI